MTKKLFFLSALILTWASALAMDQGVEMKGNNESKISTASLAENVPNEIILQILNFCTENKNVGMCIISDIKNAVVKALILLPLCRVSHSFNDIIKRDFSLEALARKYGVTKRAIALHLCKLNLIDKQKELLLSQYPANSKLNRQLLIAVLKNNLEEVKSLLSQDGDVNAKEGHDAFIILVAGRATGRLEILKELIKAGADLDVQANGSGSTALISAAKGGNTEMVRELINAGADVTIKDNDGHCNAYTWALFFKNHEAAALLEEKIQALNNPGLLVKPAGTNESCTIS